MEHNGIWNTINFKEVLSFHIEIKKWNSMENGTKNTLDQK